MTPDQVFQIVLIVGFAIVAPIGAYYRIRSQASGEKLDRRQEGWFILLTLRPVGIAGMLGLIVYMINPAWMAWSAFSLPASVRWLGVAPGILAGLLFIWTFHTLGRNLTDTVVVRQQATLITGGPYRWVRHPFYVAFALTVIANTLVTANWFIGLMGLLALSLIFLRTSREEERLIERFGDQYRDYMRTTGRFWPRWSR